MDSSGVERVEVPLQSPNTKKQFWKEAYITFYQAMNAVSGVFVDLLEIKMTLHRLNPPRLLISQSIQYFSMILAVFWRHLVNSSQNEKSHSDSKEKQEKLTVSSAASLTLLDISCDASAKIALLLSPREEIESFFGLLPLFQTVISFFLFRQQFSFIALSAVALQTVGYILVSSKVVGRISEPSHEDRYRILGLSTSTMGYVFAAISLVLRIINLTMTEMLSRSFPLSASSFCRGTGLWGLMITSLYHGIIFYLQREKIVFLAPSNQIYQTMTFFIIASALYRYSSFWLILHTSAVEYTRVVMVSNLMMFAIRHVVYKEEGATFGYTQIPLLGIVFSFAGFALLCIAPLGFTNREKLTDDSISE